MNNKLVLHKRDVTELTFTRQYVHVEELRGATTTLSTAAARGARH